MKFNIILRNYLSLQLFVFFFFGFYQMIAGLGMDSLKRSVIIGMCQNDQCTTNSYNYNIQYMSTNTSTPNSMNSILYNGSSYSCIDNEHINTCTALRTNPILQLPIPLFNKYFKISDTNEVSKCNIKIMVATIGGFVITFIHCMIIYHTTGVLNTHIPAFTGSRGGRGVGEHTIPNITTNIFDKHAYYPIIASIIIIIFILCTSSDIQLMFTQKCEDSLSIISTESLAVCNTISTCGLTLVSVYNLTGTSIYGYQTVAYIFIYYITITTCIQLIFLLICEVISMITNHCVTYNKSIINKRGEELTVALEKAPDWFISIYLASDDWRYVQKPPPHPPLYTTATASAAVYSPLSTSDTPRTPPPTTTSNTTVEAEDSSIQCSLCRHILHTEEHYGNNEQMPLIIRLQCGHKYHKVCLLQRIVIAPTSNKKEDKCYDCIHSESTLK